MLQTRFLMPPKWGAEIDDEVRRVASFACEECGRDLLLWMPFVVGFEPLPEPEDGVEEWIGKVVIQCPDCGGRRWMKVSEDTVNDIRQSVVDSIGDQPTLWPKYQDGQPL